MINLFFATTLMSMSNAKPLDDGYGGDVREPLTYPFESIHPSKIKGHAGRREINLRYRHLSIPRELLDVWFQDEHDAGWPWVDPRPSVSADALGLEWVYASKGSNAIVFAEYMHSQIDAGYWASRQKPDLLLGDYIAPSEGVGMVAIGANYAYEVPIVSLENTGNRLGIGWMIGGGLGIGVRTGTLPKWGPGANGSPGYQRFQDGAAPDSNANVSPVLPIVDLTTGVRLHLGDRAVMRFEGGVHTLLYFGTSLGITY